MTISYELSAKMRVANFLRRLVKSKLPNPSWTETMILEEFYRRYIHPMTEQEAQAIIEEAHRL